MKKKRVKFDGLNLQGTQELNREAGLIVRLLQKHYDIELSDAPDYVFFSVDSKEYYKYDCVRIFCTIEALCPDFNLADYGIGFEYLDYGDRYFRFPNYFFYSGLAARMADKHKGVTESFADREFCSFVYSNAKAAPMRKELFERINQYRKVDSGGKYLNNMADGKAVEDKSAFEANHKFSIACENAGHPGYHTEKLAEAFANRTVPVYWGDPRVGEVFNEKAFVNVMAYSSVEEAVKKVTELNEDANAYLGMLREPALLAQITGDARVGSEYEAQKIKELEDYLVHIMEQSPEQAYRRNRGFWGMQYLQERRNVGRIIEKYDSIKKILNFQGLRHN